MFFFCRSRHFQIGLDVKTDPDTRLLFCTTGVLLEKLISSKDMNKFTHVILDEVHERTQDMDFLMLLVRKLLRSNSKNVKVLMHTHVEPLAGCSMATSDTRGESGKPSFLQTLKNRGS